MEKKLAQILLEFLKAALRAKPGELASLVSLTASNICYVLRKEEHGINE